jgi:hypothetical protein
MSSGFGEREPDSCPLPYLQGILRTCGLTHFPPRRYLLTRWYFRLEMGPTSSLPRRRSLPKIISNSLLPVDKWGLPVDNYPLSKGVEHDASSV